jgi:hypothetical protein
MTKDELNDRLEKLKALRVQVNGEIRKVEADLGIRRRRSKYDPPECGTNEGYYRHRWLAKKDPDTHPWPLPKDDSCGCRAAHAATERSKNKEVA